MCSVRAEKVHFTLLLFMTVLLMFKDLLMTSLKSSYPWTVAVLGPFVFYDSAFKVILLLNFTELSTSRPSNKQHCNDLLYWDLSSARDVN